MKIEGLRTTGAPVAASKDGGETLGELGTGSPALGKERLHIQMEEHRQSSSVANS